MPLIGRKTGTYSSRFIKHSYLLVGTSAIICFYFGQAQEANIFISLGVHEG